MRRRAIVSRLARRSVSAWALPRPSATASARLANTTVRNSQTTMVQLNTDGDLIAVYRVSTEPTSTTNMTGFLIWTRGSSFLNASGNDFHKIFGSSSPPPTRRGWTACCGVEGAGAPGLSVVTDISMQSFCERAQCERREVGQADEDEDDADQHADEQRRPRVERAGALRHRCLSGQRPGQAEGEDLGREPAEQHHDAAGDLVPGGRRAQARERRPVVVGHRGERVHDLGQPVWSWVEDRG